jgi:KDO2-lipid IV(A) lauroyltransferase
VLPWRLMLLAGSAVGELLYWLWPDMRRRVLSNMRIAFGPEKSPREMQRLARATYRHYGKAGLEMVASLRLSDARLDGVVRVEGLENAFAASQQGKGLILVSAHLGNWELAASRAKLFPSKLNAVARPQRGKHASNFLNRSRMTRGLSVVPRKNGYELARELLRRNEAVVFLMDLNAGYQGLFVEFFGRLASTHRGAAALALETGAPVLFCFPRRNGDDTHTLSISPPLEIKRTGNAERDLLANTAAITRAIERQVRAYPEQWWWFQRRWKHRPAWEDIEGS